MLLPEKPNEGDELRSWTSDPQTPNQPRRRWGHATTAAVSTARSLPQTASKQVQPERGESSWDPNLA